MTDLDTLADELLDVIAAEDPLNDALEGYPGIGHLLGDPRTQAQQELRARAVDVARRARALDRVDDPVTLAVLLHQADDVVARIDAGLLAISLADYQSSPIGRLLGALPETRPVGAEQEEGYLHRLAGIPAYLTAAAQRHQEAIAAGRTPVAARVRHALTRLDDHLADPAADPLRRPPLGEPAAARRDRLLHDVVRPALAAYRDAVADTVLAHGRASDRPGLCWLPDGEATYAALTRMHCTTSATAKELHQLGRHKIEEIEAEYATVGAAALGIDDPAQVRARLRHDPLLRWSDAAELVAATRAATAHAEQQAHRWFGLLPDHPCAVDPSADPYAPSAYYLPPAADGTRPGTCYVNVADAPSRGRYLTEALTFHETVPGHHIQFGVAQSLSGLPALRRFAWINAYVEGWGLYAERLADEMGLYTSQLMRLGMLAMDSLRTARLVVDTGLHAFGWSRQDAVDYLTAHTVMDDAEAQRETDRYIDMPGQALSYLVGRMEIQRVRADAERSLGADFDLRAFHDTVLGSGALPMDVLADVVSAWVSTVTARR
ncbi:hypothetical protein AWW66_08325 [Micromonospora rosaria]|uniref:DUF885 domain-containing protein n=1 Tax=Micromonospora rosaria TaxID=47874 RepID=A0A136PV78_9ACTN|nr:DUF885 domain-containing protein [Micromonospora rosaria]KXK62440.1 hypothetical protein AWW66_08325 [Micromonospora rosaria]